MAALLCYAVGFALEFAFPILEHIVAVEAFSSLSRRALWLESIDYLQISASSGCDQFSPFPENLGQISVPQQQTLEPALTHVAQIELWAESLLLSVDELRSAEHELLGGFVSEEFVLILESPLVGPQMQEVAVAAAAIVVVALVAALVAETVAAVVVVDSSIALSFAQDVVLVGIIYRLLLLQSVEPQAPQLPSLPVFEPLRSSNTLPWPVFDSSQVRYSTGCRLQKKWALRLK